jgi:hypothetical protein
MMKFLIIDIISPLKSPVKTAAVAQDVDKSLKPKYKDFHLSITSPSSLSSGFKSGL